MKWVAKFQQQANIRSICLTKALFRRDWKDSGNLNIYSVLTLGLLCALKSIDMTSGQI